MMATVIVIQSVFLLLAVLQQRTSAATQTGFVLLSCPVQAPNSTVPCPGKGHPVNRRDDYTYTPGIGAYKVHTRAAPWNSCRKTCLEEGAHLVIINSVAEANHIAQLARKSPPQTGSEWKEYFHVGCHNLYHHDEWVTIHGVSLVASGFSEWDVGQPDREDQGCGCINYVTARLDDSMCSTPLAFICELPYA